MPVPEPPIPSPETPSPNSPEPLLSSPPSPSISCPCHTITRPAYLHDYVCPTFHTKPTTYSPAIQASGFLRSQGDHSLYTLFTSTNITLVLIYVDDILIVGNDISHIEVFKRLVSTHFKAKDLGFLKYFLRLEIARSHKGIFLNQRKYAPDILFDSGQLGARTIPFPIEQHLKLSTEDDDLLTDPCTYICLVGRLIYLTITRPDIVYTINIPSQFMHDPRVPPMAAATRVFCYIKGCPGQGIFFSSFSSMHVTTYIDSDWASYPITRYFIQLGTNPISWHTKKQTTVARSSTEAEYQAMAVIICELTWLKQLLTNLEISHPESFTLHCDNQSALYIAHNPVFHERTKHI
ncbi:uncharacterized mitochondrial protein AtMg00810-like [Juglans microcarpa x Juglans regia]|uniref:uncharacterized mitochondrial protein AtMg00810-like n=1 Tax=Juglans microcarpa x Juglans regia TaxID=2249226 RepID=UPI001B7F690E|nr:uncharacterized mitochondrial protein AtMg00810-like [Juglans microcarpa x Juglans regia]